MEKIISMSQFPQHFTKIVKKKRFFLVDVLFIVLAFCYYSFFVNKGIIFSDEGYYVHFAQRIAQGQIPYKDFALQYSPGYFYLLAFLYKIFGFQLLVGRYLSLIFCLLILCFTFILIHLYKLKSLALHIVIGFIVISLGYPLLHVPIVVWSCVFFAIIIQILFLLWNHKNQYRYLVCVGIVLALIFFFKQNLGGYFFIVVNLLFLFSSKMSFQKKVAVLALTDFVSFLSLFFLFSLVFKNISDFSSLQVLFAYSKQFTDTYRFSYPSLTMIVEPLGFFKLLPYYFPVIYLCILIWLSIRKKIILEKAAFGYIALTGFFGTVYPASDLLHVYPFLSMVIISSLVIFYKQKGFKFLIFITFLFIALGFYLTFFTKSYRYEDYFLKETTPIQMQHTKGILVDSNNPAISNLKTIDRFITSYTKKDDYIFVYPFSPMLYFLFDRNNPSGIAQFVLLEAPKGLYSQKRVLSEIKQKHVKYIIAVGPYKYNQLLSQFIQRQKKVLIVGPYIIFEIDKK